MGILASLPPVPPHTHPLEQASLHMPAALGSALMTVRSHLFGGTLLGGADGDGASERLPDPMGTFRDLFDKGSKDEQATPHGSVATSVIQHIHERLATVGIHMQEQEPKTAAFRSSDPSNK